MNTIALENAVKEADKALQNVYFKLKEAYPRGSVVIFDKGIGSGIKTGVVDDYEYSINSEMGKEGNLMVVCNGELLAVHFMRVDVSIPMAELEELSKRALAYKE